MKSHLQAAIVTFNNGCDRALGLKAIFEYLGKVSPPALNCDDILRSALILAVSSFDLFLHEIFRTEVLDRLESGSAVANVKVPFGALFIASAVDRSKLVNEAIRLDNSFKSFVAPDKLAEGLRPLVEGAWDKIALSRSEDVKMCKARLKGVVDLRNRIAHEADVNPALAGIELWPIYKEDVENSINFLRSLGTDVANVVSNS